MTTMTSTRALVTGGVDTHRDVHVAAALDSVGGLLGTAPFPTTNAGYRALLGWLRGFGEIGSVGVEGTGSYGAALARHLADEGCAGDRGRPTEPAGPSPARQDRCRRRDRRRPGGAVR